MKLSRDCKKVLDTVKNLKPNNGIRFYTNEYVFQSSDLGLTPQEFTGVLDILEEAHAIKWGDQQHTAFALTEQGRSYKEIDRLEALDRWKERIYGFICGVLASVVTAFILSRLGLV